MKEQKASEKAEKKKLKKYIAEQNKEHKKMEKERLKEEKKKIREAKKNKLPILKDSSKKLKRSSSGLSLRNLVKIRSATDYNVVLKPKPTPKIKESKKSVVITPKPVEPPPSSPDKDSVSSDDLSRDESFIVPQPTQIEDPNQYIDLDGKGTPGLIRKPFGTARNSKDTPKKSIFAELLKGK